jgi:uncharacterized small protein (DUF1192 family)
MADQPKSDIVRIELTQPQQAQVKERTGKEGDAIELSVSELEERIAPVRPQIW